MLGKYLVSACFGVLASFASAAPTFKATELGSMRPLAINDYGQVLGFGESASDGYLWQPNGRNSLTGVLHALPSHSFGSKLTDINNRGQICGSYFESNLPMFLLWSPNVDNSPTGSYVILSGNTTTEESSINDSGQMAGSYDHHGQVSSLTLWNPGAPLGTASWIATLSGEIAGRVRINNYGQIAISDAYPLPGQAFLWTPDSANGYPGTFVNLGNLGYPGSRIGGINDAGQVVGSAAVSATSWHAFRWDPDTPNGTTGTMIDLDPDLDPSHYSTASAINGAGDMVGSTFDGTNTRPFAIIGGERVDLSASIPIGAEPIVHAAALDINNHGQIVCIVSTATETRGLLLSPFTAPEDVVDLQSDIMELVQLGVLLPANGQSLYAKLDAAYAKIARGDNAG
ncbi:MAG TPA: hypothetical protein VGE01_06500, partial [Fimbriimonas sp.]